MKNQTKEQEICYINRNTKSITLTGEQINSLIEQGKAQALKQVLEIIPKCKKKNLTKDGWYLSEEELKAQLEKLK